MSSADITLGVSLSTRMGVVTRQFHELQFCTKKSAVYDCGTVQSWDGLRLGLLSYGYSRVL